MEASNLLLFALAIGLLATVAVHYAVSAWTAFVTMDDAVETIVAEAAGEWGSDIPSPIAIRSIANGATVVVRHHPMREESTGILLLWKGSGLSIRDSVKLPSLRAKTLSEDIINEMVDAAIAEMESFESPPAGKAALR